MEKGFAINVLDNIGFVRYIDHMGSDERIVEAARISYKSPSKGLDQDKKLLHYLWKNKHTSPFEMAKLTFNIKLPIFCMRQFVRHRMQNLNEVSARYTELPNEFYIPKEWRKQDVKNKQGSITEEGWNTIVELPESGGLKVPATEYVKGVSLAAYEAYEALLNAGIARELARMVLPVNIYTEIYTCWDLKNLLHFLQLREDSHSQFEIQEYARAMKAITKELFPATIEAFDKYKWKIVE
jgi:thymidylate synthase (FAD)